MLCHWLFAAAELTGILDGRQMYYFNSEQDNVDTRCIAQ